MCGHANTCIGAVKLFDIVYEIHQNTLTPTSRISQAATFEAEETLLVRQFTNEKVSVTGWYDVATITHRHYETYTEDVCRAD